MEVFSKIGLFCLIRQSKCFNWLVPVCSFTILNALVLVIHQISQSIIYVAPILFVILNVGSLWCCSLNDSRGGTLLLLLLLLFVDCYMSSHILYALYIFLCCYFLLIDRGTFGSRVCANIKRDPTILPSFYSSLVPGKSSVLIVKKRGRT